MSALSNKNNSKLRKERTMTIEEGDHYKGENTPDYEIYKILKGLAEWYFFLYREEYTKLDREV